MDVACDCDVMEQVELSNKQREVELDSMKRMSMPRHYWNPIWAPIFTPRTFSFATHQEPDVATAHNEWKPKYLEYHKESERLKSFATWPKQMNPKPEELAKVGFFYEGISDSCCCFHCGIFVHNWENKDDALEEHFRHSPKCNFVAYLM